MKALTRKAQLTARYLSDHRYVVFNTLIESKILHKLVVIASHCPKALDALN